MHREEEIRIAGALLDHLERGSTDVVDDVFRNPVSSYTSTEQLEREWRELFGRWPLFVGFSRQIPEPGDWMTDDLAPVPILVVRGADGRARAFANVCRHRGAQVVGGCGRGARGFVCPYHAWRYELDGSLAAIPDAYGFEGVDRAAHGLRPLPIAEAHGLLWVTADADAGDRTLDLAAHLGPLAEELAGYGFERYHFYTTRVLRRRMNWKLVIDTFGEAYHLKPLHRATVASIYHQNVEVCRGHGAHQSMTLARRTIESLREQPRSEWRLIPHAAVVYVFFPNVVFTVQGDHVDVLRVYPVPGRVDECIMAVDWCVPEPVTTDKAKQHWDKNVELFLRTVDEEDFAMGESIQRGFTSGVQNHLTYGRYEVPLQRYHRTLREVLRLP